MIALLTGHCEVDPGSLAGPAHHEYYYNRMFAKYVRKHWQISRFFHGHVIDKPGAPNSNTASDRRYRQAIKNKVSLALEIHHNAGMRDQDDYAGVYYRRHDVKGRLLCTALRNGLGRYLRPYKIDRFMQWPLPNDDFGKKFIVEQRDFTCVILEPAFLDCPDHVKYFNEESIATVARKTADILMEVYDYV